MTQITGFSQAPSSNYLNVGMGSAWGVGPHMAGSSAGHGGYGQPSRQAYAKESVYHPQYLVPYPFQPQPYFQYDHYQNRGMGYGPVHQQFGHPHFRQHHQQHVSGMSSPMPSPLQHTGMSNVTGYPIQRGAPSHRYNGPGSAYSEGQSNSNQYNGHPDHGFHRQPYHDNAHPHQTMDGNRFGNGHAGMGVPPNVRVPGQYGQGPHPGLAIHGGEQGSMGKANQIWITGEFFGVQRARDMLLNVAAQKVSIPLSLQVLC
jgi:hypothetical protein